MARHDTRKTLDGELSVSPSQMAIGTKTNSALRILSNTRGDYYGLQARGYGRRLRAAGAYFLQSGTWTIRIGSFRLGSGVTTGIADLNFGSTGLTILQSAAIEGSICTTMN